MLIDRPLWLPDPDTLVHVGTMEPAHKGRDSYEGHGLSVSQCPESWEEIARLGGHPWWTLNREECKFLDWHRVSSEDRERLNRWGASRGLCEPCTAYLVGYVDTESNSHMTFACDTQDSAQREIEALQADSEGGEPTLTAAPAWRLTSAGLSALHRCQADVDETPALIALLWIERETSFDGMFWGDEHAPELLSAPRAVILPQRLALWTVSPCDHRQRERYR